MSGGTRGLSGAERLPGTGNFGVLDPLFPRLAGRTDSPGVPMKLGATLLFLGEVSVAWASVAVHTVLT